MSCINVTVMWKAIVFFYYVRLIRYCCGCMVLLSAAVADCGAALATYPSDAVHRASMLQSIQRHV